MTKLETFAELKSGTLKIVHRDKFLSNLKLLKDGRYVLSLERKYKKRSNPQNSAYWGYVLPMVLDGLKQCGFDDMNTDKTHELLKFKFLKSDLVSSDGEVLETIRSTTSLTTTEMMQYISDIQQWAATYLNVVIPDPGENFEIIFDK